MEMGPILRAMRAEQGPLRPDRDGDRAHARHRRQLRGHDPRRAREHDHAPRASTTATWSRVHSTPLRRRLPARRAASTTRCRQDLRSRCARCPASEGGQQHRASCPGRAAAARPRCAPAGTRGEMLRTQIYSADERSTFDALGVEPGRGPRLHARRGGARLRCACASCSKNNAGDGRRRPAAREVRAGRRSSPRLRTARLRRQAPAGPASSRTRTATCTASWASWASSTTPTAGPSTSTRSSTPNNARGLRVRRRPS